MPTEPPQTETQPPPVEVPPETEPPTIPIIDLNTATKEELMLLPGCTEKIADAILQLREDLEGFNNPLELLNIPDVISDALYRLWEPYLTVAEPAHNYYPSETPPAE